MAAWQHYPLLLLCAFSFQADARTASASNQTLRARSSSSGSTTGFTQNSLCRQNNCVNPIFPGLNDLPRLEALTWQCATQSMVKDYMDFCQGAILYDPALPSPQTTSKSVAELVKAQDDAAMTMYVYHLSGMGYEAWDNQVPAQSDNECVRSVWKMVCYTYFPRSNAGCQDGQVSLYQRPCQSCCHNYIKQCGVECCDESVQCSFTNTKTDANGQVSIAQTGYVAVDGPSAQCTGGARRSISTPVFLLLAIMGFHWVNGAEASESTDSPAPAAGRGRRSATCRWLPIAVLFTVCALVLQGCSSDIPRHAVGNWESKQNYLSEYKYIPPGKNAHDAILNSCAVQGIPATQQCSGRGYCKSFSTNSVAAQQNAGRPLAFCMCDPEWADPECTTPRKSQLTAWFLSVFLGPVGADAFYLGFPLYGMCKLFVCGVVGLAPVCISYFLKYPIFGTGNRGLALMFGLATVACMWWFIDIVRTSSGPVYAYNFRTQNNLSHWAAILALVFMCMFIGFMASIEIYLSWRKDRRANIAKLQVDEESRHYHNTKAAMMPQYGANWEETPSTWLNGKTGSRNFNPRPIYRSGQQAAQPPAMQWNQGFAAQQPGANGPPTSTFTEQPMVQLVS